MPRQGKLGLLTDCEGSRFVFEPRVLLAGMAGGPLGSFISTPMELVKVQVRRTGRCEQTERTGGYISIARVGGVHGSTWCSVGSKWSCLVSDGEAPGATCSLCRQMQLDSARGQRYRSSWHAAQCIVREGGVRALYTGHVTNTVREVAFLAAYFGTYEHSRCVPAV